MRCENLPLPLFYKIYLLLNFKWYTCFKHLTSRICSDSAKQYVGVEKLFGDGTVHLATNHSIGEYVNKEDSSNTINHLENQNKLLKRAIICRRTSKLIHQYMALYYYRQQYLEKHYKDDLGSQIMQFLLDIKRVYPGIVNGVRQLGLELRIIDPPTVESEGLEHLIPGKCPRIMTIDEEFEELSADNASVEDLDSYDLFWKRNKEKLYNPFYIKVVFFKEEQLLFESFSCTVNIFNDNHTNVPKL